MGLEIREAKDHSSKNTDSPGLAAANQNLFGNSRIPPSNSCFANSLLFSAGINFFPPENLVLKRI